MNRVLLVDDEEGIRKVLGLSLTDDGYEVEIAESGREALQIFEKSRPKLVITDIKMPGMDGIQLLKEIKMRDPLTEVIIITGHGEMELAIQSLQLEASDFITKPINHNALNVALKRARERIKIKETLQEYTENLERIIGEKISKIKDMYDFQTNLIENAQEGILATDVQGNILFFNKYMEKLTGYQQKELSNGRMLENLFPGSFVESFRRRIRECIDGGRKRNFIVPEATISSRSGELIPVQISVALLYEGSTFNGVLINAHDLRAIKKLQQELIQSERLVAIGQTVASVAHAIKNILGGLNGGIYVLDKGIELDNPDYLNQGWDMVKRNIAKIKDMVMELLAYSKEREPDYKMISPNEPAEEVYNLMKSKAEENDVVLIKKWDQRLPLIAMDPQAMHTCLANIVANGIDACADLRSMKRPREVCMETAMDAAGNLQYRITDNGCGMDQKTLNKIFTRFFSTKGGRGTGLGMMVTDKIIREHGGQVHISSEEGNGTMVVLSIPARNRLTQVA